MDSKKDIVEDAEFTEVEKVELKEAEEAVASQSEVLTEREIEEGSPKIDAIEAEPVSDHKPGAKPKGMPQALWNLIQKAKNVENMFGLSRYFGTPPKDKPDFILKKSTKKRKSRRKMAQASKRKNRKKK